MSDPQHLVACFNEDGTSQGWLTNGGTLSYWSSKALRFSSKQAADNRIVRLELTWPKHYLWCAEREPKYDIDVRTGARLDSANAAWLDTINRQPLKSALTPTDTVQQAKSAVADEQGESMPVKKKIVKPVKKTVSEPVPKMKLRTTSAKAKRATASKVAASNDNSNKQVCVCGCGELTASFLKRGHFKRVLGYLRDIKAGTLKPEKAFGSKQLAAAYGPWTSLKSGGMKSAVGTDYAKVRANLSA